MRRGLLISLGVLVPFLLVGGCGRSEEETTRPYLVGLVTNNPNGLRNVEGFRDGMAERGYVEGTDVTYVFDGKALGGADMERSIAAMVDKKVDLIFTAGTPTGVAAHRLTRESGIPVVFGVIADPVAAGVMWDLNRPGGNMTGVKLSDNQDRRFYFLLELAPGIRTVFVPFNPKDPAPTGALEQIRPVAAAMDVEILEGHAIDDGEVLSLLEEIPVEADAIFMLPDSTVNRHMMDVVATSIEKKLPLSGPSMTQVEQGAVIAYGIIHHKVGVQAAAIADKILKGADPGELPVETAEAYLGINLSTATRIGLEISTDLIQQAEFLVSSE